MNRNELKEYCKKALLGKVVHHSKVFSYMAKKVLEDGTEIDVPIFVGNTYIRPYPKANAVRKPQLTHNNQKRRRMIKLGLI